MSDPIFARLTTFLTHLNRAKIHYTLACYRDHAIMVLVTVPGERWEIEFIDDGSVEVERFMSDGEIAGEEVLTELFAKHGDQECKDSPSPQQVTRPVTAKRRART
jgi:hypothetical protein